MDRHTRSGWRSRKDSAPPLKKAKVQKRAEMVKMVDDDPWDRLYEVVVKPMLRLPPTTLDGIVTTIFPQHPPLKVGAH